MNVKNFPAYAPIALRLGIAGLLFYFGISQLRAPENWTFWLPAFAEKLPLSLETLIILNGTFEVIAATLILIGLFTRPIAALVTIHLLAITIAVGYTEIGVRDASLTLMSLAHFFLGADKWSVDTWLASRKKN